MIKSKTSAKIGVILNSILLLLSIIITSGLFYRYYTPPKIIPVYDEVLSPKVNAYLESVKQDAGFKTFAGSSYIDHASTYCYNFIYGYSEEYVFAYVTCKQYAWAYHKKPQYDENGKRLLEPIPPVEIVRELCTGRGGSSYIRLSYKPGTDFEFTGYEYPEPGVNYYKSTTEMFQMKNIGLPPAEESARAFEELEARFHAENDDAPIPKHI